MHPGKARGVALPNAAALVAAPVVLFPLGTVIVTAGPLRDRAVRWWAIPFAIGTIPTARSSQPAPEPVPAA
jgi:hypothetical protein